jgi:dUTP pyrophosphatase
MKLRIAKMYPTDTRPLPEYATLGSSGLDVRAYLPMGAVTIPIGEKVNIPTGLRIAVPDGYEAQVRPRSGLASKRNLTVLNTPGTIDSDYRGEVIVMLINHGRVPALIEHGERIAQLVVCPVLKVEVEEVTMREMDLDVTGRGSGGFGSTGAT